MCLAFTYPDLGNPPKMYLRLKIRFMPSWLEVHAFPFILDSGQFEFDWIFISDLWWSISKLGLNQVLEGRSEEHWLWSQTVAPSPSGNVPPGKSFNLSMMPQFLTQTMEIIRELTVSIKGISMCKLNIMWNNE